MVLSEVLVPMLNANESTATLVAIHVAEGQWVEKESLLFTVETTKVTGDLEAPAAGYLRVLVAVGETLNVGAKIAVITQTADEHLDPAIAPAPMGGDPVDLRITDPARRLAISLGLDLERLPKDKLITAEIVRNINNPTTALTPLAPSDLPYVVIFGISGHAKTLIELLSQRKTYAIAGLVVDAPQLIGNEVMGYPILGTRASLPQLLSMGVAFAINGVGGIPTFRDRLDIFDLLEKVGFHFPTLISPHATVERSASFGEGVQVFANAYIGTDAILGSRSMINTGAIIAHDCEIGSGTHIAPGAKLAGKVRVGERTLIGMGVTTNINLQIGSNVRIGNGAIILEDVPDNSIIHAGHCWTGIA